MRQSLAPSDSGCRNVIQFLQGKHIGAHDTRQVHPGGNTDHQDDDADAAAEGTSEDGDLSDIAADELGQHDQQEQGWNGQHGFGEAHQNCIHPAAVVGREARR